MQTVTRTIRNDAAAMPKIERSSGEAFRQIPDLAQIADDTVTSQATGNPYRAWRGVGGSR